MPYKDLNKRREKDRFYKIRRRKTSNHYRLWDKQYRLKNLEKWKMKERKYQVAQYGITLEEYNRLFVLQNGKCAICSVMQEKSLDVDHCHKSKKVRGLLCRKCNLALGFFLDNPDLCIKASNYLRK